MQKRLENADITGFRNARMCGMLIHFEPSFPDQQTITWTVKTSGEEVASFTVTMRPMASGTQTSISVPKSEGGSGEMYDGNQHYQNPAMMQPLRPAVQELIDAAVEQRPYDWHRIPDPLNTDALCGSERTNFEAGGATYVLGDPEGMPHEVASKAGLSVR